MPGPSVVKGALSSVTDLLVGRCRCGDGVEGQEGLVLAALERRQVLRQAWRDVAGLWVGRRGHGGCACGVGIGGGLDA